MNIEAAGFTTFRYVTFISQHTTSHLWRELVFTSKQRMVKRKVLKPNSITVQ